mmetsp:Transcript_20766/g.48662  ORF Transcript_20766/g.48662 Transcript_20766/m.48662 type:complete len:156 (-) Transcript_20766:522-989(-)
MEPWLLALVSALVSCLAGVLLWWLYVLTKTCFDNDPADATRIEGLTLGSVGNLSLIQLILKARQLKEAAFMDQISEAQEVDSEAICTICLEALGDRDSAKRLKCGHVHHASCLLSWCLKFEGNLVQCPQCRYCQHFDPVSEPKLFHDIEVGNVQP